MAAKYDLVAANATRKPGLRSRPSAWQLRILRLFAIHYFIMHSFFSRLAATATVLLLLSEPGGAQSVPNAMRLPRAAAVSQLTFEKVTADCAHPFGLREGQNLEYQLLNSRGKVTGVWRYRVLSISSDTTTAKKQRAIVTTRVRLKSGHYDLQNQVLAQQDLTYFCRNDTVFTDGVGIINYDGLKSFRDRKLAFEGTPVAWPNQPTAGSNLAAGGVTVQVSSPSVAIAKVKTTLRQRTVRPGKVSVTVPAGNFSCYVVESQRELATQARTDLILKSGGREVDYYDPTAGIVKVEYYDKKGKLVQTRVLAKR